MHLSAACVKICYNLICITRYNYKTRERSKEKLTQRHNRRGAYRDYTILVVTKNSPTIGYILDRSESKIVMH